MQNSAINAAIKARKDLMEQIEYISSIPNETIRSIAQTASLTTNLNSSIKSSLLKAGHVNVINLNTNELIALTRNSSSNLGISQITNSLNFQRNLFSEEAIKSFKEIYRFNDDIVSQAQQTIRDLYVNPTAVSTLIEAINSTYQINENNTYNRYDEFICAFKNDYPHPFKTVIKWSSSTIASADIGNFAINYINNNDLYVQNSLIFAIVCLISFLSTYYPYSKK
ncbi:MULTISPECIES: hypothetical protein [Staphylococcus]|uniref:Uncharacterized protein n=1 Tax=Staphylococcus equorum TaxID=246432 RepID=A0A9X4L817_9STAP|nr:MULTISPECIES: hypothetical protein [Staphylococcus]MDG0843399.1 hypothetical protein [Staphylococcus equorum]MDG0858710.1 hypothetical protein [Staphylococcus equorum]